MTRHKPAGSCTQATRVAHKWEKGITKTSPGGSSVNGNAQWRGEAAAPRGANMNFCLPQTAR
ncbi:hypothetical protein KPMX200_130397 [Klebsiella pneumoniae]|nr:hypothetical protein NUBL13779_06000 [Klebsiella pneumoniae]SBN10518.1 hypothetical protein KPMX200_130397 [Klebsiella pneumoniae]